MRILFISVLAAAVFCCVTSVSVAAGPAQLIADIDPGRTTADGDPSEFVQMNGYVYYRGYHPDTGYELWRTNGTTAGTRLVKDVFVGLNDSDPRKLIVHGGYLYFLAKTTISSYELWRSDGTAAGTVHLLEDNPYSEIVNFHVSGTGQIYLEGVNDENVHMLMVSDGSSEGTRNLKQIDKPYLALRTEFFGEIESETLFSCGDGAQVWATNGTVDGTRLLKVLRTGGSGYQFFGHVKLGEKLYFAVENGLWCSDGTEAGTVLVKAVSIFTNGRHQLRKVGDTIYISASESFSNNMRIWKSDGTSAGTVMVSSDSGANPYLLTATDNLLYYVATTPTNSSELWRSDGTGTGTFQVTNFNTPGNTVPGYLTPVGARLFFRSYDDGDLYVSDGTVAGTTLVNKFEKIVSKDYDEWPTAAFGTSVIFTAEGGTGRDLWISDGTAIGTRLVHDPIVASGSNPSGLLNVGNRWFFHADDGVHGREPWVSDGTAEGTFMLKDVHPGSEGSMYDFWYLTEMNGKVYFPANDGVHGVELWVTDGTKTGTHLVAEVGSGPSDGLLTYKMASSDKMASSHGPLFFVARTQEAGIAMWVTDGTAEGTRLIRDVLPFPQGSVTPLTVMNGDMYFICTHYDNSAASSPIYDTLWKTDGTYEGTVLLTYFDPITYSFLGSNSAVANGILYFPKYTYAYGAELWRTDGTPEGTRILKDINPGELHGSPRLLTAAGDLVYFDALGGLWKSDDTETGTVLIKGDFAASMTSNNGLLMFGIDYSAQAGLWQSDGSGPGTKMIHPLPAYNLQVVGTDTIYAADDGIHGKELWLSSGLGGRTEIVQDINPFASSLPESITPGTERVLFTADDGVHGRELWSLDIGHMWPTAATGWELYK